MKEILTSQARFFIRLTKGLAENGSLAAFVIKPANL